MQDIVEMEIVIVHFMIGKDKYFEYLIQKIIILSKAHKL